MEKAKKFSYVNDFPNPLEELHQFLVLPLKLASKALN